MPRGREILTQLAAAFTHGVEVTSPYPAEMFNVDETLEHLFDLLVYPGEEHIRASSQRQFERGVRSVIGSAAHRFGSRVRVADPTERRVNGVSVNVGVRTTAGDFRALWRALSLHSVAKAEDQLTRAKAVAMDINVTRTIGSYQDHQQFVALQLPKQYSREGLDDSVAWLRHEADEVMLVPSAQALATKVEQKLARALPNHRSRR